MNVIRCVFDDDIGGSSLIWFVPGAHPQEESAIFDLALQVGGVMMTDPTRKHRTNQSSGTASQDRGGMVAARAPPEMTITPIPVIAPR